jgi:exonuclease III
LRELESSGKPVILTGDLNVAYQDIDFYNPTAKHINKQAGLTPQERASFGSLLATQFQDALRYFYPGALQKPFE